MDKPFVAQSLYLILLQFLQPCLAYLFHCPTLDLSHIEDGTNIDILWRDLSILCYIYTHFHYKGYPRGRDTTNEFYQRSTHTEQNGIYHALHLYKSLEKVFNYIDP